LDSFGRNGAGKSTLLNVLLGNTPEHLPYHPAPCSIKARSVHLPQEPVDGGLGVEPIGLSHVLSARGLDQIDADMQHARHALAADPTDETIERFTSLEETFRERADTKPSPKWRATGRRTRSRGATALRRLELVVGWPASTS